MKRSLQDDSDNDDFYDEDLKDGSPTQSYHLSDRKKRRGVIEKRRRDRINSSLTELRRLVPAAFEKQGSAKLEKAEILQMAVDHLKNLNAKGYNIDTATLAMDYRMVGFRECASEVARYLVSIEGLDVQDPLRLRVINHLHCYCAQRETAVAKAASSSLHNGGSIWNQHAGTIPPGQYGRVPSTGMLSGPGEHAGSQMEQLVMAAHPYGENNNGSGGVGGGRMLHHHTSDGGHMMRLPPSSNNSMTSSQMAANTSCSLSSASQMVMPPASVLAGLTPSVHHAAQFLPMLSPNSLHHYNAAASMALSQGMRPYRPWGADLVY